MNNINYINLYNLLIQPDAQLKVKKLDQTERKEVVIALKALQKGDWETLKTHSDPLDRIINKLEKLPANSSPRSSILMRIFKGIMNLFYRHGSGDILSKTAKITDLIRGVEYELKSLPDLITKKRNKIFDIENGVVPRSEYEGAYTEYGELEDLNSRLLNFQNCWVNTLILQKR
jgi:hypothetical protein